MGGQIHAPVALLAQQKPLYTFEYKTIPDHTAGGLFRPAVFMQTALNENLFLS
jgi:hypothetical protein